MDYEDLKGWSVRWEEQFMSQSLDLTEGRRYWEVARCSRRDLLRIYNRMARIRLHRKETPKEMSRTTW